MHFDEAYTFDDVLIKPQYSDIRSRSEIDLSVSLSKGFNFRIPTMPANMKTIVNETVAEEFYRLGGLCLLHRFNPVKEQLATLKHLHSKYTDIFDFIGVSIGVKEDDYINVESFYELGVRIFCIDIAHGESEHCIQMIKSLVAFDGAFIIAGNVATGNGAFRLWDAGADAVKVGVGAGSICSTRIATGCGVPQLSALIDVYNTRKNNPILKNKFIIADGGCTKVGDIVKSLSLSDIVMAGNLFAGAIETPGEVFELDGKKYKRYDGSSTHKADYIEGVQSLVELKSSISSIVKGMMEGISSGCSYTGSRNLAELKDNTVFVKITNAGMRESGAHDVHILGKGR